MHSPLDYARGPRTIRKLKVGYITLIVFNSVALIAGAVLFSFGSSGGIGAPVAGVIFGGPLLLVELLPGCVSWIFLWQNHAVMRTRSKDVLTALSILPSLTGAAGIALALFLP